MARLLITGPHPLPAVELAQNSRTIGRAEASGIRLDGDPAVSRLHAVVEPLDHGWLISDLGSRNGTFVNGTKLTTPIALRPGDQIGIGPWLLFYIDDAADDEPTFLDSDNAAVDTIPPTLDLSPREIEVLALVAGGATDQQIAHQLIIALTTVRSHLDRIRDKTGCRRRPDLTRLAIDAGITPQPARPQPARPQPPTRPQSIT